MFWKDKTSVSFPSKNSTRLEHGFRNNGRPNCSVDDFSTSLSDSILNALGGGDRSDDDTSTVLFHVVLCHQREHNVFAYELSSLVHKGGSICITVVSHTDVGFGVFNALHQEFDVLFYRFRVSARKRTVRMGVNAYASASKPSEQFGARNASCSISTVENDFKLFLRNSINVNFFHDTLYVSSSAILHVYSADFIPRYDSVRLAEVHSFTFFVH